MSTSASASRARGPGRHCPGSCNALPTPWSAAEAQRTGGACSVMPEQPAERFDRERRVVDTMLTAHSVLRDRYERRATGLTLVIMGLSVLATGVAFISGEPEMRIGPV